MKDEQPNQRRLKLFQEHKNICTSALELMVKKNHDYSCEEFAIVKIHNVIIHKSNTIH